MKSMKWILVCVAVLLLMGCAGAKEQGHGQEKEKWKMNEAMMEMIKDAVGCNDRRAKAILEVLQEVQISEPVEATPKGADGNSIIVKTADGGAYEIGINKKHYVFSVRDLSTGKYVYMVIE